MYSAHFCLFLLLSAMFSLSVSTTDSKPESSTTDVYPYSIRCNQTTLPPLPMIDRTKTTIDYHLPHDAEKEIHLQPLEDSQNHVVNIEGEDFQRQGRLQQLVDILLEQDLNKLQKDNLTDIVQKHHDLYLVDHNKEDNKEIKHDETEKNEHVTIVANTPDDDQMHLHEPNNLIREHNYMKSEFTNNYAHNHINELHLPSLNRKIRFEEIPLMQKKQSQAEIMKSLDDYSLQRKITHYVLPEFHNNLDINYVLRHHNNSKPKRSVLSSSDSDFHTNGHFKSESDDSNKIKEKLKIEITKSKVFKENAEFHEKNKLKSNTLDSQTDDNLDIAVLQKESMLNALREQSEKMYDLIQQIQKENKRRSAFLDFEKILNDVEVRKKKVKEEKKTSTTTTTEVMSVQEMMIDETMVKEALRNDPYVKRILKLSNMKKEEFFKNKN